MGTPQDIPDAMKRYEKPNASFGGLACDFGLKTTLEDVQRVNKGKSSPIKLAYPCTKSPPTQRPSRSKPLRWISSLGYRLMVM